MSSPASPSPSSHPSSSVLAGLPTHVDLAPSIVFVVAYALLLPLFIWRFVNPASRTMILLRPGIFIVFRLATFILRAVIADGHYTLGLIIAQSLLLSIGFIMLCLPLTELYSKLAEEYIPKNDKKHWLNAVARFLKLALLACIVIAIVISSTTSSAITNPNGSAASTIHTLRIALNAILLGIVAIILFALARLRSRYPLNPKSSGFLAVLCLLLLIIAAFRLSQAIARSTSTPNTSKALFFTLVATPEWLAALLLFTFNVVELFEIEQKSSSKGNYDKASHRPLAGDQEAQYSMPSYANQERH